MEIYKPVIIANVKNDYTQNKVIVHFGNVYTKICNQLGVCFDFNSLHVVKNENNNLFCDYTRYLNRYIFNSTNINKKLLNTNERQEQVQRAKSLLQVINMYNIIYKNVPAKKFLPKHYNIFHVGKMMQDLKINQEFIIKCFLSCSLDILNSFLNELQIPYIYEIEVSINQPVFFLFDNIEQLEILLPPGTKLSVKSINDMEYLNNKVIVVKMSLI